MRIRGRFLEGREGRDRICSKIIKPGLRERDAV